MQRFKIISKKEGTAPANVTKELSLCHIALDYSSTISASQTFRHYDPIQGHGNDRSPRS